MGARMISWDEPVPNLKRHLAAGGLLVFPTESSYGLGADPRSVSGVEAIYRLKERERGKPLPVVAGDLTQLELLGVDVSAPEVTAVVDLWPAPLSLVLPAAGPKGPWPASGDGATLAIRIPAHERLRALLSTVECPLTATSANLAGQEPILDPQPLMSWLGDQEIWILDGGRLAGGPPSTLVAWQGDGWKTFREGRFAVDRLPKIGSGGD